MEKWRTASRRLMCSVVDGLPSTPSCRALLPADALHPDIGNGGDVAHCIGGMCESGGKGRSALMLRCVARTGPFIWEYRETR
ncbi:MAG: hypothetical protein IKK82_09895 [Kiritimatiellae bacterium]|nr:hypothetical protein [Kiritimatiellia bacterium]